MSERATAATVAELVAFVQAHSGPSARFILLSEVARFAASMGARCEGIGAGSTSTTQTARGGASS